MPNIPLPQGGVNDFTFADVSNWIQLLFHLRENGYFAEHPTFPGKKFEDWSGIRLTTDGVKASLHYQKIATLMLGLNGSDGVDDVPTIRVFYAGPNGECVTSLLIVCHIHSTHDCHTTRWYYLDLLLSNDLGRVNIMQVIARDYWGDIIFTKVLTLKYCYHVAKINQYQCQVQNWNTSLNNLFENMSTHCFKTLDQNAIFTSFEFYSNNSDTRPKWLVHKNGFMV